MSQEELFARWKDQLDEDQLKAASHHEGPAKVIAAAGSGKSRMVVARIARLVAAGVDPKRILAVTFSTAGASVMNSRLDLNFDVTSARVGTWHSLCLQIIKDDFLEQADWDIDDKNKAKHILKEVLGYKYIDWKTADLARVMSYISLCKAAALTPDDDDAAKMARQMFGHSAPLAVRSYRTFEMHVQDRQLLTFDDMLVYAHRHLKEDEDARARWANKFDFVIQDEGQDASLIQDYLSILLAKDHRNYMLVGDPRQSLFSFRGASPSIFQNFETTWPGSTTYVLPRCYRSAPEIVTAGNRISQSMVMRTPDSIAVQTTAGKIEVKRFVDEEEEAKAIAVWCQTRPESKFVLYRLNRQSRAIEEALISQRIPYEIRGSVSFYERKEVKDLLAYLRLATSDDIADAGEHVKRCINAPFRYLGAKFVDRLFDVAQESKGFTWSEIAKKTAAQEGLQARQRSSAEQWSTLIENIIAMIDSEKKCGEILTWIVSETRYTQWLVKEEGEETADSQPLQNVAEILRIAQKFETVAEFLGYIDDQIRLRKRQRKTPNCVLMSCHRSKGLEAKHVWIAGVSAGAFPFYKADPEEERRVFYVATTRAEQTVTASFMIGKNNAQGNAMRAGRSEFLTLLGVPVPGDADDDRESAESADESWLIAEMNDDSRRDP